MSVGTNFAALKTAAKATIEDVASVGKIETRTGGAPTWVERNNLAAFWELSVLSATETDSGAGPQVYEDVTLQLEGFMPFDYGRNTEAVWDALLPALKDALRANPCLKNPPGSGTALLRDSGRPQLTRNDFVNFSDGQKVVRCHHAVILLRCRAWFVYSPA